MDIISRLPGCAGQAADAVSAYTQVKNGRCSHNIENSQIGANKTTQQLYKVSTPCIDDHHFKQEVKSVGELSNTCSQIVLNLHDRSRNGPSLWQTPESIDFEYKQNCHVGNTAKQCRLLLFQDSDFAGDLKDSTSTSGGTLCVFGSRTFVPISWR